MSADRRKGGGWELFFKIFSEKFEQAEIVIAEITPANPNVFYELDTRNAMENQQSSFARRESQLPFDIQSYRVVFYNDTIGGKPEVERSLRRHLDAIAGQWQ